MLLDRLAHEFEYRDLVAIVVLTYKRRTAAFVSAEQRPMMFLIKLLLLGVKDAVSTVEDLFSTGHLYGMIFDSSHVKHER